MDNLKQTRFDNLEIYVMSGTGNKHFNVRVKDPTISYGLTFTKESEVNRWLAKCDMTYYQNQVNFAVYCATTLSGLPAIDEIKVPFKKAVYQFHVYYQVRKILKTLQVPLSTDETFNSWNNNINKAEFGRLCDEFRISPATDFRTLRGSNNGLGTIDFMGSPITGNGYIEHRDHYALPDKHFTFAQSLHIAKIERIVQSDDGWKYFVGSKAKLTSAGIVRLNDSIRTYVYCILASQSEARSAIMGSFGTELDAQKQLLRLLEDSINQHADIPVSIARYQRSITDTHTRLDYVIASGLYIIPSDMILKVGKIENYNNNIQIATTNMKPGKNDINLEKRTPPPLMEGTSVKTYKMKSNQPAHTVSADKIQAVKRQTVKGHIQDKRQTVKGHIQTESTHENIKFILFAVTGGLVSLALYLS